MKKIIILLSLLIVALFVVSCNGPVAGQAIDRRGASNQALTTSNFCADTDVDTALTGKDWLVKNVVTISTDNKIYTDIEDSCSTFSNGKTYLMEGRCSNNQYIANQKNCGEIYVNGNNNLLVCKDGACVPPNTICDTLQEGELQNYLISGKKYEVVLSYVENTQAKFIINGEPTSKLQQGNTFVFQNQEVIVVNNILYQSYAGGVHQADFCYGPKAEIDTYLAALKN